MMLRRVFTSEPSALPRLAPARPRTASRANPPFVRNLPPHARANARFYKENLHRYGGGASSGSVVANDPVNKSDFSGKGWLGDLWNWITGATPPPPPSPPAAAPPATDEIVVRAPARLPPNFKPPTNPPQYPASRVPNGVRLRMSAPRPGYPNGYWQYEKPMSNGGYQGINPSTMKPGPEPDVHVPFPTCDCAVPQGTTIINSGEEVPLEFTQVGNMLTGPLPIEDEIEIP